MAGTMRKMMEYLSLAEPEDELYDDAAEPEAYEDEAPEPERERERDRSEHRAEVTPISRAAALHIEEPVVTEDLRRIVTVHPASYNEARVIGEAFREGTPVIMNVSDMGDAEAKRLVDFSAGLVFALHGSIERVTGKVFLLTPSYVEVVGHPAGGEDETDDHQED
jgi:cell division inhibitor SepF